MGCTIVVFDEKDHRAILGSWDTLSECREAWFNYTTRDENQKYDIYFEMRDPEGYAIDGVQFNK